MADTNIKKFLTALLGESQNVENSLQQLWTLRGIDIAEGTQLDVLGRLVGQPRNGLDDDIYRRYVRARISVHRSAGTLADVVRVVQAVLGTQDQPVRIHTIWNASMIIEITDEPVDADVATVLLDMLRSTVSAGVRFELVTTEVPLDETFILDIGPGLDVGHLAAGVDNV